MKMSDLINFLTNPEDFTLLYKGQKVKFQNEAGRIDENSRFFAAGFEFGAHVIVCVESYRSGDGFSTAWEAWIDNSPTIPDEELIEAYSPGNGKGSFLDEAIEAFRSTLHRWTDEDWKVIRSDARKALDAAVEQAKTSGNYPDLVEGYEMQSNCTGTGIVSLGHYAWMHEAELDELEIVRKEENPSE